MPRDNVTPLVCRHAPVWPCCTRPRRGRQTSGVTLSPRAGLALLHASQAWALMNGRDMVLPEDIQAIGIAVMGHRLGNDIDQLGQSGRTFADNLLHSVPVP